MKRAIVKVKEWTNGFIYDQKVADELVNENDVGYLYLKEMRECYIPDEIEDGKDYLISISLYNTYANPTCDIPIVLLSGWASEL